MAKPKLPIGIQSFPEIRARDYAYADKTPYIARLADSGKAFFLSRPRRFGKSLLVDTLDCAFSGRRELFRGLYLDTAEAGWDWSRKHPVLCIDFATGGFVSPDSLLATLHRRLDTFFATYGVPSVQGSPGERLYSLLEGMTARGLEQAVVLVDEYDKPILDNLHNTSLALAMRDVLKDFYGALKPADPFLRLVFLTGVTKFAKTGVFSGLNHLNDLTINKHYSAICGYTQADMDGLFAEWMVGKDREGVREWYNGYAWLGESVYNPFDALLFFENGEFRSWWFETGTPTFLLKQWQRKPYALSDFDTIMAGDELVGSFDLENLKTETLLFQAGYLTIKGMTSDSEEGTTFLLGFPNREVRQAFSTQLLPLLAGDQPRADPRQLRACLESGDGAALQVKMQAFFASIPHDWYRNNPLRQFEGYYASVVYAWFASLGYEIVAEDTTNKGRIDLTVKARKVTWLFEFKVRGLDKSGDRDPLEQLLAKGYGEKYRGLVGREGTVLPVRQIGIVFDAENRNIEAWSESAS